MPNALELPRMLRAVIPLMCARDTVVNKLVALTFGHSVGTFQFLRAASGRVPFFSDFIVMFYEPQQVELLTLPGTWPAPLEVSFAIKAHIEWAGKSEILCKMPLKKFPVAGCKSFVRSLC